MSNGDLERARPPDYADGSPDGINSNTAPVAKASAIASIADKTPNWVFLLISIIALVLAMLAWNDASRTRDAVRDLSNAMQAANTAMVEMAGNAARAAAKAETATARANVSELYAKQLFTEMNRLGYPIRTPAEEHVPQPPETAIPENPQ